MTERRSRRVRRACGALGVIVACCALAAAQTPKPNKKQVFHNESLSGDGTVALPLKLVVPLFLTGSSGAATISARNPDWVAVDASSSGGYALFAGSDTGVGVYATSASGVGVYASSLATTRSADGRKSAVFAQASAEDAGQFRSSQANGVFAFGGNFGVYSVGGNIGVFGTSTNPGGRAGYFQGDVEVTGTVTKTAGASKIDHPVDPANKYLSHAFVESPDMMNLYNGNTVLDATGQAVVELPEWFGALNKDFRYQLTAVGAPGPDLYIALEVANNRFTIAGGKAGMKVSWMVTGIRQDAWATAHRIPVEQEKAELERGHYLHPELFDQPEEKSVDWARQPELMKQIKAEREQRRTQQPQ